MSFTFHPLGIPDVVLVRPRRHGDARGWFSELWRRSAYADAGIDATFVQDNVARSEGGVLRGLHYQRPPGAQGKLVQVTRGRVFDVAVDLRPGSPTHGRWVAHELSAEAGELLWIPPGFAHGYAVLGEGAERRLPRDGRVRPRARRGRAVGRPDARDPVAARGPRRVGARPAPPAPRGRGSSGVSGPVERHVEVARTARYWMLGATVAEPRELWFVLHGYGQLARRFLRRFEALDDGTRRVVAPEALSRFYPADGTRRHGPGSVVGASWMTREDREREIADYVAYLDRVAAAVRAELGPARAGGIPCAVLGFSQGVATAARWSVLGAERPARLALWGDFLPPDLDLEAAREAWSATDVVLVRGSADPALADPARAEAEAEGLARAGLTPARLDYEGGHEIEPRALDRLLERWGGPRPG